VRHISEAIAFSLELWVSSVDNVMLIVLLASQSLHFLLLLLLFWHETWNRRRWRGPIFLYLGPGNKRKHADLNKGRQSARTLPRKALDVWWWTVLPREMNSWGNQQRVAITRDVQRDPIHLGWKCSRGVGGCQRRGMHHTEKIPVRAVAVGHLLTRRLTSWPNDCLARSWRIRWVSELPPVWLACSPFFVFPLRLLFLLIHFIYLKNENKPTLSPFSLHLSLFYPPSNFERLNQYWREFSCNEYHGTWAHVNFAIQQLPPPPMFCVCMYVLLMSLGKDSVKLLPHQWIHTQQ
jgi:hypothetical protein